MRTRRVQEEFARLSEAYEPRARLRARREARALVAWIRPQPGDCVLDAASGPGWLGRAIAGRVRRVYNLDVCPEMLRASRAPHARALPEPLMTVGEVERLPFPSRAFQILTCSYAFANFEHPAAVLKEFARVTCGDGRIVVIDVVGPEARAQRDCMNRLEACRGNLHTRLLSRLEFMDAFREARLRVVAERCHRRTCRLSQWLSLSPAVTRNPGQKQLLRRMLMDSIDGDKAGLRVHVVKGEAVFYHTTAWFMLRHV